MTELEQYLKSYFDNIQPDELSKISPLFELTTLRKGGYFLKAGKRCDKICIIQTGILRVFALPDQEEVTQWIATKGYLGTDFSSFFYDTPSRWTIQALTDTELFTLSKSNYRKIGEVIPQWTELEKLFLVKCFTALENRIFSHLSMTAEERYNLFFTQNNELFNQVPLKYIASMLGMTPETLSRICVSLSMKTTMSVEIKTEILINANPEKVWAVLTDFRSYPNWNPFITSLTGEVAVGNKITVHIEPPGASASTFKPKVLLFVPNKEISWLGQLLFAGVFDGLHKLELMANSDNTTTLFKQSERFSGILVPLFRKQLENNTKAGFQNMNQKLKELAESK